MHDHLTKKIRRRIEEYLRSADENKIIALAIILDIKVDLKPKLIEEPFDKSDYSA